MKAPHRDWFARFAPAPRFRKARASACIVALAAAGLSLGGCEFDESCVETATCPPADGGSRDSNEAGSFEASNDARIDGTGGDVLDASQGVDRIDREAAPPDRAEPRPDTPTATTDAGRNDGNSRVDMGVVPDAASVPDAAMDAGMPDHGSSRDGSEADVPSIDASDGGATDGQHEGGDAPPADVRDACLTNACGGCAVLAGAPGASCGSCGSYACSGPDNVTCNDPGLNACNGCGVLAGTPGASCGSCGQYVCATDKASVSCDHPDFVPVTQVALGHRHTCVLLSTGSVRCWGLNESGQLGDNSTMNRSSPTAEVLTDVASIVAGGYHTCAVRKPGGVRCWGHNALGQLGDGSVNNRSSPPNADIADLGGVTSMTAGVYHTCAVISGTLRCWGSNSTGQLGDTGPDRLTPGPVILNSVGAVASGFFHNCVHVMGIGRC